MKKNIIDPVVIEFVRRINGDRLYYLLDFIFKSKPAGYMPDLCDLLSKSEECGSIDHWLKSSENGDQFFEKIDQLEAAVFQEVEFREKKK